MMVFGHTTKTSLKYDNPKLYASKQTKILMLTFFLK